MKKLKNTGNAEEYISSEKRLFNEVVHLKGLKNLQPEESPECKHLIFNNFDFTDTTLKTAKGEQNEEVVEKVQDFFARHCIGTGSSKENKINLNPNGENPGKARAAQNQST